jgi:putative phosphoribosyl transferase
VAAGTRAHDSVEAGRKLGEALAEYRDRPDVLVLALPRGNSPVGVKLARALDARLDLAAGAIEAVARRGRSEVERRDRAYREGRPPPEVAERTVIPLGDGLADEVVCVNEPDPFIAIGVWYDDIPQLTDDEVRELQREAAGTRAG